MHDFFSDLVHLLKELDPPEGFRREVAFAAWNRVVGDAIRRRTKPQAFQGGTLTVEIEDPSWADQMEEMKGEILGRLQQLLGAQEIRALRYRTRRP
ncbi:MAG: DUF721 domain-containing protein [Acidobacteria bacterium]|nr:DUF721 domain-containing protein [Acidobacteriota bacterium]